MKEKSRRPRWSSTSGAKLRLVQLIRGLIVCILKDSAAVVWTFVNSTVFTFTFIFINPGHLGSGHWLNATLLTLNTSCHAHFIAIHLADSLFGLLVTTISIIIIIFSIFLLITTAGFQFSFSFLFLGGGSFLRLKKSRREFAAAGHLRVGDEGVNGLWSTVRWTASNEGQDLLGVIPFRVLAVHRLQLLLDDGVVELEGLAHPGDAAASGTAKHQQH
ncbi:hypothetical protein TYRP_017059 [Tyrophagus putrescentiae]|nr:hypothetical protein TYRP_017059 [Tyrophagus putrescentiae]